MKILLAVDDSPHSQEAVREVAARPWPPASVVRVLSAVPLYVLPATEMAPVVDAFARIHEERLQSARDLTERLATALRRADLTVETAVAAGDPRSAIVDEAAGWGADLIVMGSHGRTGVKRWLLGSVAQAVVGHAPCSVQVVRAAGGPNA